MKPCLSAAKSPYRDPLWMDPQQVCSPHTPQQSAFTLWKPLEKRAVSKQGRDTHRAFSWSLLSAGPRHPTFWPTAGSFPSHFSHHWPLNKESPDQMDAPEKHAKEPAWDRRDRPEVLALYF